MEITLALFAIIFAVLAVARADMSADKERSTLSAGDPSKFVADQTVVHNSTVGGKNGWVSYKQCDSRWGGNQLGWCNGLTICSAGCAMTSVAMMLTTKGANVDPGSLDVYLSDNGGYVNGCDIIWAKADDYGKTTFIAIEQASESEICNGLSQGHGIIANVNNGGHWVLLTGCAGGGVFYVNDPGYSRTTYSMSEIVQEAVYH